MTRGPAPIVRVMILGLVTLVSVRVFALADPPAATQNVQALYHQLRSVGLDPNQVYKIRDAVLTATTSTSI